MEQAQDRDKADARRRPPAHPDSSRDSGAGPPPHGPPPALLRVEFGPARTRSPDETIADCGPTPRPAQTASPRAARESAHDTRWPRAASRAAPIRAPAAG